MNKYLDLNGLSLYHNLITEYIDDGDEGSVKVSQQTFTTSEKAQARTNIQADIDEVDEAYIQSLEIPDEVISTNNETIKIFVGTDVTGVNTVGLTINAYYNNSETISASTTTDQNGVATIQIPLGTQYRLVFPEVTGMETIQDIEHIALMSWRFEEVKYTNRKESVTIHVQERNDGTNLDAEEILVNVTIDGTTTTYTTDSNGEVNIDILYGKSYTVALTRRAYYYILGGIYSYTYTSQQPTRTIDFLYREYQFGLYYADENGIEYTFEQFTTMIENDQKSPNDALYIVVRTETLQESDSCFGINISDMATRSFSSLSWANSNTQFNSIALNGYGVSNEDFYNGLSASLKIQDEGDKRNIDTPAVDGCLKFNVILGESSHRGFLGGIGQWQILWENRFIVDDMIKAVRPNAVNNPLSGYTTNKWSSTQYGASDAWYWTTSAYNNGGNGKVNKCAVVPFFAF